MSFPCTDSEQKHKRDSPSVQVIRGHESEESSEIEPFEADASGSFVFFAKDRGDQETTKDEEEINSEPPCIESGDIGMNREHGEHRDRSESIE